MLARPYQCYACHSDYLLLPDRCSWCGETMFINLDHAGISFEMYPTGEEEKKKLRADYDTQIRNSKIASEAVTKPKKPDEEFNVFSGFVDGSDYEDDVDHYGGMETDQFLVLRDTIFAGWYSIAALATDFGLTKNAPVVIVAKNYITGDTIGRYRGSFHKEMAYNSRTETLSYGAGPLLAGCGNNIQIEVYCDLDAMNLKAGDVRLSIVRDA